MRASFAIWRTCCEVTDIAARIAAARKRQVADDPGRPPHPHSAPPSWRQPPAPSLPNRPSMCARRFRHCPLSYPARRGARSRSSVGRPVAAQGCRPQRSLRAGQQAADPIIQLHRAGLPVRDRMTLLYGAPTGSPSRRVMRRSFYSPDDLSQHDRWNAPSGRR